MTRTKVLVVDDEVEFASTLAERLRLRGYDARAVFNAEDAVSAAKSDTPEVLLLDMKMPGVDGAEIMRNIKQVYPHVEFIILTGKGIEDEEKEVLTTAFAQVIKPMDINGLTGIIDSAKRKKDTGILRSKV